MIRIGSQFFHIRISYKNLLRNDILEKDILERKIGNCLDNSI